MCALFYGRWLAAPVPPLHFFQEVSKVFKGVLHFVRCVVVKKQNLICGVNLRCLFGSLSTGCKLIQLEPLYADRSIVFPLRGRINRAISWVVSRQRRVWSSLRSGGNSGTSYKWNMNYLNPVRDIQRLLCGGDSSMHVVSLISVCLLSLNMLLDEIVFMK